MKQPIGALVRREIRFAMIVYPIIMVVAFCTALLVGYMYPAILK